MSTIWKCGSIVANEVSIKRIGRNMKRRSLSLAGEGFEKNMIERKGPSGEYAGGMMWGSFAWGGERTI